MKYANNIREVALLEPDYMGFIFYPGSPRYVGRDWEGAGEEFPGRIKKVGVFVNEPLQQVIDLATRYGLDLLQLHGDEAPHYCRELYGQGYGLIKAISLKEMKDLKKLEPYKPWVEYFLFDTPGAQYGGTGKTFDWSILKHYDNEKPFILSGGISLEALASLEALKSTNLAFIDVNSRFEDEPGLKNPKKLKALKRKLTVL